MILVFWESAGSEHDGERVTSASLTPTATDYTEVLSQRTLPGQGEVREAAKTAPKGDTSAAGNMGEPTPMETEDRGHVQFGPQPNVISETHIVPEPNEQPPSKEGAPTPPATFVNAEAPDTLVRAIQSATIVEEHRTLMSTVVEEFRSAKSGLNEAYTSLLRGFEVCNMMPFSYKGKLCVYR